jgi:hypothetical protein
VDAGGAIGQRCAHQIALGFDAVAEDHCKIPYFDSASD